MSTKSLLPDQCTVLHAQYGAHDCCLCKAREEIAALREALSSSNERLDMVREPLGVNYWLDKKDGHDAHVYANDYVLSPAEIVERLNEATKGWEQKSAEVAALREENDAHRLLAEGAIEALDKLREENKRLRNCVRSLLGAIDEGDYYNDALLSECWAAALDGKEDA